MASEIAVTNNATFKISKLFRVLAETVPGTIDAVAKLRYYFETIQLVFDRFFLP